LFPELVVMVAFAEKGIISPASGLNCPSSNK